MILDAFLAIALAATPPIVSGPPPSPPTAIDWAATARADIEAGYALMRDNHPGFVNPDDPDFRNALEAARAAGNAAANDVHDAAGYGAALAAFSTVLGDGHASLRPLAREGAAQTPTRWPGFMTAWRGDRMLIVSGEAAPGLGQGSTIAACDGRPIAELMVERLRPRAVRLHEAGQWWAYGTRVLTDAANVAGPPPGTCDIVPPSGGAPRRVTLTYRDVPDSWMRQYWTASNGGFTDVGLTEPRPGFFLIGMPTFDGSGDADRLYKALDADIARHHAALEKARAVVIDLRFNQGGSSQFSREAAQALWGKPAVESRLDAFFRAVEVWWRNSPGTIARLDSYAAKRRSSGRSDDADEYLALTDRMRADAAAGRPLTVEEPADLTRPAPAPAPVAMNTPVYVIVPGQCASACLDALDAFTRMPDVTLVGAPSSGDSLYMDVRQQELPSGLGTAVIPLKVWMHRPRGGGEIYRPRIELRQADWSTDAFLDAVEADLSKRARTR